MYVVLLPHGMSLPDALTALGLMVSLYRPGMLVYEEAWLDRRGGVAPDAGGLTSVEVDAVLKGDVRGVRSIHVARFLWRVVALEEGRTVRVEVGAGGHSGDRGAERSVLWTTPTTVVVVRCDDPAKHRHRISLDEVGIRFSRPYALAVVGHRHSRKRESVNAVAAAYNQRLAVGNSAAQRLRADVEWRLRWLDLFLWARNGTPLNTWTTVMPGFVPLLTLRSAASMSALTWWAGDTRAASDEMTISDDSPDDVSSDDDDSTRVAFAYRPSRGTTCTGQSTTSGVCTVEHLGRAASPDDGGGGDVRVHLPRPFRNDSSDDNEAYRLARDPKMIGVCLLTGGVAPVTRDPRRPEHHTARPDTRGMVMAFPISVHSVNGVNKRTHGCGKKVKDAKICDPTLPHTAPLSASSNHDRVRRHATPHERTTWFIEYKNTRTSTQEKERIFYPCALNSTLRQPHLTNHSKPHTMPIST